MREVDYTKLRKGTRIRGNTRIDYCPKCGRKGEVAYFGDGSVHVTHRGRIEGMFLVVTDSCFIKRRDIGD